MSVRWPTSVRARTTTAASLLVALFLAAAAWLLLVTLEQGLEQAQDDATRGRLRGLAALAESGRLPARLGPFAEDTFGQVVAADGTLLASSPRFAGRPVAVGFDPGPGQARVRDIAVREGDEIEDYRVWAVRAQTPDGRVVAYVGSSRERVTEAVSTLTGLLLLGVPLLASVLAGLTWVVLGRALHPVEAIRSEVADISSSGLDRRVPVPPGDDEIARLARTMNEMLERLEQATRRLTVFTSDASHELLSPLAAFRTELEVALAHQEQTEWPEVAEALLEQCHEMEGLVRDLLFLAQQDERGPHGAPDRLVDLDDVVLEEAARLRAVGSVVVDTTAVSAAPVPGDRQQLRRLVRNLLDNAARHAASRVEVRLGLVDDVVELVVLDDGPGVPAADRERIFERFVRLDDARARDSGGAGLGLAIVAAIAAYHGGRAEVRDVAQGAAFVVSLPAATVSGPAGDRPSGNPQGAVHTRR